MRTVLWPTPSPSELPHTVSPVSFGDASVPAITWEQSPSLVWLPRAEFLVAGGRAWPRLSLDQRRPPSRSVSAQAVSETWRSRPRGAGSARPLLPQMHKLSSRAEDGQGLGWAEHQAPSHLCRDALDLWPAMTTLPM